MKQTPAHVLRDGRTGVTTAGATLPRQGRVVAQLLWQCTWRHWKQQPRRTALLVLLVSIGVSVFLSMRLANRAAVASFTQFAEVLTQQSDAILTPRAGLLSEAVLERIQTARQTMDGLSGVEEVVPLVETSAALPRTGPEREQGMGSRASFTLLGVDLIALQNLATSKNLDRSWFSQGSSGGQDTPEDGGLWKLLEKPNALFCAQALADEEGLNVGSKWSLILGERTVEFEIAGIIPSRPDQPVAPKNLLVMDLPALQTLSGKEGRLDRVEFLLDPQTRRSPKRSAQTLTCLSEALNTHGSLNTPESRQAAAEVMTRGFRLNLTILSLIAMLVGLYLIFQALDAAVLKRRSEIGILRALGVTAEEIRWAWLWEALLLGLTGGLLGVFGGWALAQGTVRAVSQTVNTLYYASNTTAAALHLDEALGAMLLAVASSLVAGWLPARRAAATLPAQLWAQGAEGTVPAKTGIGNSWLWGLVLTASATALAFCPPLVFEGGAPFSLAGYASAFLGVLGAGVLAGEFLPCAGWLSSFSKNVSPALRLANSHLRHPSSRHRWAVAGLVCAIAMTGGMAVLVGSFETSVSGWIRQALQSDIYITSDANQNASANSHMAPAAWKRITSDALVADWDGLLISRVELPGGLVRLNGTDMAFNKRRNPLLWLDPPRADSVFNPAENEALCLVSESFTARHGIVRDGTVRVPTPTGERALRVAGVYTDYGDDKGIILVERRHMQRWFETDQISTLALVLQPGSDAEAFRAKTRASYPGLAVYTNAHLRAEVMRIFRQTFAITYALEGIGVLVALAGLGTTLASVLAERRAELTTLRALGMSHAEIARVAAWEGALLSVVGTGAGLLAGTGLGALLVFVINKQTFGWTLQLSFPPAPLLFLALLLPASGALVAWAAGRWGADLPADRAD
jgi:putative ABC transport system permease protein